MKEPFNGWPFKTWVQGYVLGLINGAMVTALLILGFYVAGHLTK